MTTKIVLTLGTGILLAGIANAQLFTEHFNYPNGNLGASGSGNTVWMDGDSANSSIVVNSNATFTYPGLSGAAGKSAQNSNRFAHSQDGNLAEVG